MVKMKQKIEILLLVMVTFILLGGNKSAADEVAEDCTFKEFNLYGKVQFVTSFPDIKIQYVNSFPDIKVKYVNSFPDDCGEWQVVESFPDFKVQVVESFPDLKVQIVESFPGMN